MEIKHDFYQQRDFTAREWKDLKRCVNIMIDRHTLAPLSGRMLGGEPFFFKSKIFFNGIGKYAGQQFIIKKNLVSQTKASRDPKLKKMLKEPLGILSSCKTDGLPYDHAVTATLILATRIAPNIFKIKSMTNRKDEARSGNTSWYIGMIVANKTWTDFLEEKSNSLCKDDKKYKELRSVGLNNQKLYRIYSIENMQRYKIEPISYKNTISRG